MLSFVRKHRLPNWPYHVAFHQQKRGVPVTRHIHQHLVSVRWIWAVLTGGWWYLTPVSICISLMTFDVRHLLRCLLYISFGDACEGLWPTFGIKLFNFSEYRILGCWPFFFFQSINYFTPLSFVAMVSEQKSDIMFVFVPLQLRWFSCPLWFSSEFFL